jgi:alpha-ketoglutarate-dependent taurine dioxygenase
MLGQVAISAGTSPEEAAALIHRSWRTQKVVHITGVPTDDLAPFYERLVQSLGTPEAYAEDVRLGDRHNQRSGKVWMEVRYEADLAVTYRHSANAQPLHTDGSYIPGYPATLMYCVSSAPAGGETVFIDSRRLVQILEAEDPALLSALREIEMPHARSGDRRSDTVLRFEGDDVIVNWNYYCVAEDVPPAVQALRERFFAFLRDSPGVRAELVPLLLKPGEGVIWKDDRVLHGRNAFDGTMRHPRFLWKCAVRVDPDRTAP